MRWKGRNEEPEEWKISRDRVDMTEDGVLQGKQNMENRERLERNERVLRVK